MYERADEYRAKARECEEQAAATTDQRMKEQWLRLAAQWRGLAEERSRFAPW